MAGVLHWTLTESALDDAEIRRRLEGSRDRQFRALSFPAGVETIEEMEKMWAKIDFGGKQSTQEMTAVIEGLDSHPKCVFVGHFFLPVLVNWNACLFLQGCCHK